MAQQPMKAKLNYKPKSSIEVFYSGGAVSLSKNGLLACACQDDIKVSMASFCSANLCRRPCQWSGPSQALVNSEFCGLQIVDTLSGAVIQTLSGVSYGLVTSGWSFILH